MLCFFSEDLESAGRARPCLRGQGRCQRADGRALHVGREIRKGRQRRGEAGRRVSAGRTSPWGKSYFLKRSGVLGHGDVPCAIVSSLASVGSLHSRKLGRGEEACLPQRCVGGRRDSNGNKSGDGYSGRGVRWRYSTRLVKKISIDLDTLSSSFDLIALKFGPPGDCARHLCPVYWRVTRVVIAG